jgi:hypothetical protein
VNAFETQRLILRPFEAGILRRCHSYASCYENVRYMSWGPSGEEDTRAFLARAIAAAQEAPLRRLELAAVLKGNGRSSAPARSAGTARMRAEVGWILHRGFLEPMRLRHRDGRVPSAPGLRAVDVRRIVAHCAALNYASYA